MDFIVSLLKGLFDRLRIANPTLAAIVLLALSVLTYGAIQGDVLGLFHLEGVVKQVVSFIGLFLTATISGGVATAKK